MPERTCLRTDSLVAPVLHWVTKAARSVTGSASAHNMPSSAIIITASGFRPPSTTVVSAEPFLHGTGTLRCLQKEMETYRHWSVSFWRDPDDITHCRILFSEKGLSMPHSADEDAVSWLNNYGSWHAYEKNKKIITVISVTNICALCQ